MSRFQDKHSCQIALMQFAELLFFGPTLEVPLTPYPYERKQGEQKLHPPSVYVSGDRLQRIGDRLKHVSAQVGDS